MLVRVWVLVPDSVFFHPSVNFSFFAAVQIWYHDRSSQRIMVDLYTMVFRPNYGRYLHLLLFKSPGCPKFMLHQMAFVKYSIFMVKYICVQK